MKIRVTWSSPAAIAWAVQDSRLDEDQEKEFRNQISKWVHFGELVTIEFDTDEQTAIVVVR